MKYECGGLPVTEYTLYFQTCTASTLHNPDTFKPKPYCINYHVTVLYTPLLMICTIILHKLSYRI